MNGTTTLTKKSGFLEFSVKEIRKRLQEKTISALEITRHCIEQVKRLEPKVQAWVCFDEEKLTKAAEAAQKRLDEGGALRPLEAVPVGIKDIMNTIDFPTEMGSPIWRGFTPGNDARVVTYVKWAGGLVPGKTVTAEFAVHTLGKTRNPHNTELTPGTSSSGSAAAIATGMVPVALGTQTAGSIVRPASFCGIYGYKPSFGLLPRTGMLKTTDSLDTVGFFTAHLDDVETVLDALRVHGPNYPLSDEAFNDKARQSKPKGRPWKVALVKTHVWSTVPNYAKQALLEWAQKLEQDPDIEVREVELPALMNETHEVHAAIYDKSLAYYFKEESKKHQLVSPIMNEIIAHGNTITLEQFKVALAKQEEMAADMDDLMQQYDILLSLSTAGQAPPRDVRELPDPALMWTMTFLPVLSAPVFASPQNLPFGAQIVARRYNDLQLMEFCRELCRKGYIPAGSNPKFES